MKIKLIIIIFLSANLSFAQNWYPLGDGINTSDNGSIELFEFQNKLFAGGNFNSVDNKLTDGIAYWNDINWISSMPSIGVKSITSFATYQNELYGFAQFNSAGDTTAIVKYDKSTKDWSLVDNSRIKRIRDAGPIVPGIVRDAIAFDGDLYIVGDFDFIGDKNIINVARWDGSNWFPIRDENSNAIIISNPTGLIVHDGELIIASGRYIYYRCL